jgi:membrane-associated PAP2 superfamily phosphatase
LERYPFKLIYFETAVHGKKFLFRGKCFPLGMESYGFNCLSLFEAYNKNIL